MRIKNYKKNSSLFLVILFSLSCSNIFAPISQTDTDSAKYEDALKAINDSDYVAAITLIESTSSSFRADEEVIKTLAGAYAGKCGLNFIDYFNSLQSVNLSGTTLFLWFMNAWTGATTDSAACTSSETLMKTIHPTVTGRTSDESLFMVILGMTKMGVYLNQIADTNDDGITDSPPFDGTNAGNSFCSATNISDVQVAEIGAGLGIILANIGNINSSLGIDLSSVTSACNALPDPSVCQIEDEATFLAAPTSLLAVRTLLNTSGAGMTASNNPCP